MYFLEVSVHYICGAWPRVHNVSYHVLFGIFVCYTIIPGGQKLGAKGAKALALEVGCLSQLTMLDLRGA